MVKGAAVRVLKELLQLTGSGPTQSQDGNIKLADVLGLSS